MSHVKTIIIGVTELVKGLRKKVEAREVQLSSAQWAQLSHLMSDRVPKDLKFAWSIINFFERHDTLYKHFAKEIDALTDDLELGEDLWEVDESEYEYFTINIMLDPNWIKEQSASETQSDSDSSNGQSTSQNAQKGEDQDRE